MEYYPFPAILRTDYNGIKEHGTAQVSEQGDALNFFGEFVPLVPLSQPASIDWILGDKVLATFEGKVYLSSAKTLQLIHLDSDKLSTAITLFQINVRLPALVAPPEKPKAHKVPVEILYLSMSLVKLLVHENIGEGTELHLYTHVDFLTLRALELRVRRRIIFHKEETILLCEIEGIGRENYVALSSHVARLEKRGQADEEPSG